MSWTTNNLSIQDGIAPWHTAFYLTAGLLLLESLVFGIFASGVEQPWNNQNQDNAEINLEGCKKSSTQETNAVPEENPILATKNC